MLRRVDRAVGASTKQAPMSNNPMKRQISQPVKAKGVVHKMIADTAKGIAREAWESLAKQNAFYALWPEPEPFVTKHWPDYLPVARATLTGMLGSPQYSEHMKAEIYEVLLKDGAVNPKKMAEPERPAFFKLTNA